MACFYIYEDWTLRIVIYTKDRKKEFRMEFNEIINELNSFKGTEEYENYISGLMTADRINKYLETEEGKNYVNPIADARYTKGLETWKQNHLQQLIDEEVKKRYPDQTPEQKRIAELEAKFNEAEEKALKSQLTTHAIKIATNKNLPTDLVTYFIGKDETETNENINGFETAFNSAVEKVVNDRLGDSHKPDAGEGNKKLTIDDIENMSIEEAIKVTNQMLGKNKEK